MKYRLFGKSGLRVSEVCLGTMTFGEDWGWGASKEECKKIFETYVEAGGNFIDTANFYTQGTSESIVGELIASARQQYVLATKYSLTMRSDDPNAGGNHRKNMIQSLEASLKRLNTDYVDIYWLHAWDFTTPVEEVIRALDDMVSAGKVLYIGISDTPVWIVSQANTLAALRGWSAFIGLQVEYSLIERAPERDLLPMAESFGMSVTAWSPLGGGVLTGKYNFEEKEQAGSEGGRLSPSSGRFNDKNRLIVEELKQVASELECTPAQVALSWVRAQSSSIIPIIGSRKVTQFSDNIASLHYQLNEDQLARLHEASRIELGFPHDFLASRSVKDVLFGQKYDRIMRR
ncbi:aldo/keto reductase [Paenibacillus sp. N1-5-1-14]|uniref:aldo/keto reductase n=1 Tax=Paenibacillus radicibacter TaxID=2972488 RepID=UPI002158A637|nr:aldo/keto reductase [Paenibacillus radicibacter]MCR8644308.1 aldo/keto reductase [Paenibacillus radicibacter]